MTGQEYVEMDVMEENGRLYHNRRLGTIEGLIPNPYDSCHAADLLELQNGDMLCCWFAGSNEGNADISIVVSRMKAGENQWSEPVKVSDDPERSEQNPSLFLTPDGEIWLMYTAQTAKSAIPDAKFNLQYTAEIRRKISRDNGETWGKTETLFSREGSFCRQKIQVLSNGRWVFGNWICFRDNTHNGSDITVVQISDDQGKSWRGVEIPGSRGRVHANLLEVEPGRLIALFRSRSADNIYYSASEDWGESWSVPVRTELPNNNSSISAIKLQSGALALAYNPVRANDDPDKTVWPRLRCPVAIALSDDDGKTWPAIRLVEMGDGYIGAENNVNNHRYEYPVVMQSGDGRIHVAYSYYDRRCVKYVVVTEDWIRGERTEEQGSLNPTEGK
ncbi:MAG TPA: exo-alpha-sialidase [Candidatus Eisenbergiella merdavium]|uniref:Exo-alpha-sialidase n=1 Tax=Candidatus Eisenbergiella merdavium TaxID=2838551 RepID=A0A9D2NG01_9FIRM|nr:exo-alpha-sialidase [Candidatus Eisenbergiella merdavium]